MGYLHHDAPGYQSPAEFAALCESARVDESFTKELQLATALPWQLVQTTGPSPGHSYMRGDDV